MQTKQYRWSEEHGWDPHPPSTSAGSSAQAVLLFANSTAAADPAWYNTVRSAYPDAHLFGCTTSGQIQGADVHSNSVVATAVTFDHSRVEVASTYVSGAGGYAAGKRLASLIDPAGLRYVLVLLQAICTNANDVFQSMESELPPGTRIFGGCASDGHLLTDTYVLCNSKPQANTIAALAFYGERLKAGFGSSGGWDQFGLDRLITRSEQNVLYEFDGRPALPLYKKYIGAAADQLPASGMLYPLRLRTSHSPQGVLRGVLAVDERQQSITFAGNVPEGSHARLMFGSCERLIEGGLGAAQQVRSAFEADRPDLMIVVSCAARQLVLKHRTSEELEGLNEAFPVTPVTGFYALGEIGPSEPGGPSDFHNETMTVMALAES